MDPTMPRYHEFLTPTAPDTASAEDAAADNPFENELQTTLVVDLSVKAVERRVRQVLPGWNLLDNGTFSSWADGAAVIFRWTGFAGRFSGTRVQGEICPGREHSVLRYRVTQNYWDRARVNAVVLPIAFAVLFGPWAVLLPLFVGAMVAATSLALGIAAGLGIAAAELALAGLFVWMLWTRVGYRGEHVDRHLRRAFAEHLAVP
jgi:hypothetical protein